MIKMNKNAIIYMQQVMGSYVHVRGRIIMQE